MKKELDAFLKSEFGAIATLLERTGHELAQNVRDALPHPPPELEFPAMVDQALLNHGGKAPLAGACGYRNISKGCRRIDSWREGTSLPDHARAESLAPTFGVTPEQIQKIWASDQLTREFGKAMDRAQDPTYRLVVRLMAAVYNPMTLPAEMTLAEALGRATVFFARGRRSVRRCLVLPNGLAIYISGGGRLEAYCGTSPSGGLSIPLLPATTTQ